MAEDPGYCEWVKNLEEPTFFEGSQAYLKGYTEEPPKKKQTTDGSDKCKVCYDKPIGCVFVPCGHLATCLRCGLKCERLSGEFPICKEGIALVTQDLFGVSSKRKCTHKQCRRPSKFKHA